MLPAFVSLKRENGLMARPKSGPGAKRPVWHTLLGKQQQRTEPGRRLGSSRVSVVAREQASKAPTKPTLNNDEQGRAEARI